MKFSQKLGTRKIRYSIREEISTKLNIIESSCNFKEYKRILHLAKVEVLVNLRIIFAGHENEWPKDTNWRGNKGDIIHQLLFRGGYWYEHIGNCKNSKKDTRN